MSTKTNLFGTIRRVFGILAIVIILSLPNILSAYSLPLRQKGKYFLPFKDRFTTDGISARGNSKSLEYKTFGRRVVAEVNFDEGIVIVTEYIDGHQVYQPRVVPIEDFQEFIIAWQYQRNYFDEKLRKKTSKSPSEIHFEIPVDIGPIWSKIVGEGGVGLKVSGRHEITLQGRTTWNEGEIYYGSRWPTLHMEQRSNFNISGTIGSKIKVNVSQDSERSQSLENTINIKYEGEEDDVIQSIEAGNTNISLSGAEFVGYSERVNGLFGLKSEFRIGDLQITGIASQEQGENERKTYTNRAEKSEKLIKDINFKDNTYFYIDDVFVPGNGMSVDGTYRFSDIDSIFDFTLYTSKQTGTLIDKINAWALWDLSIYPTITETSIDAEHEDFYKIEEDDYWVDKENGFIILESKFPETAVLACSYKVLLTDGTIKTVGYRVSDAEDSEWVIKLIKPSGLREEAMTWEYMWRNVYDLGFFDLTADEVKVDIVSTDYEETEHNSGNTYVELFGLDELNAAGITDPDGYVDPVYIDYYRGELIFPYRRPFDPSHISTDLFLPAERVKSIYETINSTEHDMETKYSIRVESNARSTTLNLGWGILENSETIKLGNDKLIKGQDYIIDYDLGRVSFISDRAKDPNANITVDYEVQPFFQFEQKTLLGARAKYFLDFEEKSWIGTTALYRSVSMVEQRPRVGGEPSKGFIWDVDLNITKEVPFLTAAVDALPFIETEAASEFTFAAEYAYINSNPNTKDDAYIDDFEGVQNSIDLGIRRGTWKKSSVPVGESLDNRANVLWYNPYDKVDLEEIWPNKGHSTKDSKVDILRMDLTSSGTSTSDSSWVGLMHHLNSAYSDMQNMQFLEVWVKGTHGNLTIDLGYINEDINNNSILESEDLKNEAGIRDGVLEDDEDVGLDGRDDDEELDWYLTELDEFTEADVEAMSSIEKRSNFQLYYPDRDVYDPEGDNWSWDDHDDYSQINGTEGNGGTGRDYDTDGGGKFPDTEDLNGNNYLDRSNDYFSFTIDLSDSNFYVEGTKSDETGSKISSWRLYRIPIQDSIFYHGLKAFEWEKIGTPDWRDISYVRMWIKEKNTVLTGSSTIRIASLKLVGSTWLEDNDDFYVSQRNTDEDYLVYYSPPGVEGIMNYEDNFRSPEQSMSLVYDKLPPLNSALCYKLYTDAQDYTLYNELEMWVHGDESSEVEALPQFFFRLGTNANTYYEFVTDLEPGWSENNKVEIDFVELTNLKKEYLDLWDAYNAGDTSIEPDEWLEEIYATSKYRIVTPSYTTMPSLNNIKYLAMGVYNATDGIPLTGEVWVDELIVTDVRRDPGSAQRVQLTMNFADFIDLNGEIRKTEDDFHGLTESKGDGSDKTSGNLSSTLHVNKVFPDRWKMTFPIRYQYDDMVSLPKLLPRSDIILENNELREANKTTETQHRLSTNLAIRPEEAPIIMDLTLSRMTFSFSGAEKERREPTIPYNKTTNMTLTHDYNLTPANPGDHAINLLGWVGSDSTSKKDDKWSLDFQYLPTKFTVKTDLTQDLSRRVSTSNLVTKNKVTRLKNTSVLGTEFLPNVNHTFNLSLTRDLSQDSTVNLPYEIGLPINKDISNTITWKPELFKDYLKNQNYSVSGKYTENTDPARYGTREQWGTATQNRTINGSLTFNHKRFFGEESASKRPRDKKADPRKKDKKSDEDELADSTDITDEDRTSPVGYVGKGFKWLFLSLDPVKANYQQTMQNTQLNLAEAPSLAYQLALTSEPNAAYIPDSSSVTTSDRQQESNTLTRSLTLGSGMGLPWDIDVDVNFNNTYNKSITSSITEERSTTFPDLRFTWRRISQLSLFKKYTSSVNANSTYKLTNTSKWIDGKKTNITTKHDFAPVFSLNVSWRFGLQSNFTWNRNITDTESQSLQNTLSRNLQNTFSLTLSYNLSAKKGIKLPLFGKVEFENALTLKLTGSYTRNQKKERFTTSNKWSPKVDTEEISIVPSATYRFSQNIDASFSFTYQNSNDLRTSSGVRSRVRQVSIKVILKF